MVFGMKPLLFFVLVLGLCFGETCEKGDCVAVPLINRFTAPLTVQLDTSDLNEQLEALIKKRVKQEVEDALSKLVHAVTDKRLRSTEEKLMAQINGTMVLNTRELNATFEHHLSRLEDHLVSLDEIHRQEILQLSEKTVIATQKTIQTMDARMKTLKQTSDSRSKLLEMKVQEMAARQNRTDEDILTKIAENSRKVAVTSCLQSHTQYSSGDIFKFSNVKMSSGVSNLSAFKSTGKFTCEYPGLYHVTVTMATRHNTHLNGFIMKNTQQCVRLYDEQGKGLHSSTAAVTLILDTNDTVYMKSIGSFYLYALGSCMSITKIK